VQRQTETAQESPIEIEGAYAVAGGRIAMRATFRLVDPVLLTDLRATLLVYEDNLHVSGDFFYDDTWQHATRTIRDTNITLGLPGDEVEVTATAPLAAFSNPSELHVVAFVQRAGGDREVYQAAFLTRAFEVVMAPPVRSVPEGNGDATFRAVLRNTAPSAQTFLVQPGSGFGDWMVEFAGCGHPDFGTDPIELQLGPGAECALDLRVHTASELEIRSGGLLVNNAELAVEAVSRVFNASPAVMLIDSRDTPHPVYAPMAPVLQEIGILFEDWSATSPAPGDAQLEGFDIVICDTEYYGPTFDSVPSDSVLIRFMNLGGAVFLAGQEWLPLHPVDAFLREYFGVADFYNDQRYVQVAGVPGDPIGDGLDLPLQFVQPWMNHDDVLIPMASASPFLLTTTQWPAAVRNQMLSGTRTAFLAFPFSTISASAADPNNQRTVLRRVVEWLRGSTASGLADQTALSPLVRLHPPVPNPFSGVVDLRFALPVLPAMERIRLEIFDPAGRLVRELFEGRLPAGAQSRAWDGRDDRGRPLPSGVYFARLSTAGGIESRPVVLLRR
jgi:hypothetical protein